MEKSKDKRLEEKEKIEAEIERSMSVVREKQAHMQIEEVEKTRKKPAILSIIDRINANSVLSSSVFESLTELRGKSPELFGVRVLDGLTSMSGLGFIVKSFESIRFDFQRNIEIKNEDFEKLFPKLTLSFDTGNDILTSLTCMTFQMLDMKAYCKRLL